MLRYALGLSGGKELYPWADVSGPKAQRLIIPLLRAFGIVRGPSQFVLEKPYGFNLAARAQIEPMIRPARNSNHVPDANFDGHHRLARWMDVKQPLPLNHKSDFVFIMPMLAIEFVEHLVQAGRRRVDIHEVH